MSYSFTSNNRFGAFKNSDPTINRVGKHSEFRGFGWDTPSSVNRATYPFGQFSSTSPFEQSGSGQTSFVFGSPLSTQKWFNQAQGQSNPILGNSPIFCNSPTSKPFSFTEPPSPFNFKPFSFTEPPYPSNLKPFSFTEPTSPFHFKSPTNDLPQPSPFNFGQNSFSSFGQTQPHVSPSPFEQTCCFENSAPTPMDLDDCYDRINEQNEIYSKYESHLLPLQFDFIQLRKVLQFGVENPQMLSMPAQKLSIPFTKAQCKILLVLKKALKICKSTKVEIGNLFEYTVRALRQLNELLLFIKKLSTKNTYEPKIESTLNFLTEEIYEPHFVYVLDQVKFELRELDFAGRR